MRSPRHAGLLLVLAACLLAAACGGASQTDAQREQEMEEYAQSFGVDVDVATQSDGSVAISQSAVGGGFLSGTNLDVPAGFPDDIPIYPQMNVIASGSMPTGQITLQGLSPDTPDRVAAFYSTQMADAGWTETTSSQQSPVMRALQFTKGERMANINVLPNGSNTMVQLVANGG